MIDRLKPYPACKDSGIEWLGGVPEHWEVERAKWLFRKMDRPILDANEVVTCFRDGTVTLRRHRRVHGFTEALQEIGYQGIRQGDLVIHAMDAFAGAIGVADSDGKGSPVYSVCKPTAQANSHFYAYAVREMARSQWIQALATGIRERSTDFRFKNFGSQLVPLPPLSEQTAIVRFLDHADRRIQRYISGKQKLIKLLEEQKQAIIHRAVTRGLDPKVRLKPSGIEWLRDVPAHWKVRRLRTIAHIINGATPSTNNPAYWDGNINWITPDDLGRLTTINITDCARRITHEGYKSCGTNIATVGSLAISTRAPIGHIGVLQFDACVNQGCRLLTPTETCSVNYLYYMLKTTRSELESFGQGSTFTELSRGKLDNFRIPLPPLPEQTAIVEYLDKTTANINTAIDRARRQIELLSEYRTRLISDVVTGKLDVRDVEISASGEESAFDGTDGLEEETESDEADVMEEVYGDD